MEWPPDQLRVNPPKELQDGSLKLKLLIKCWELSYTSELVNRDPNLAYIWKLFSDYSNFWMLVIE